MYDKNLAIDILSQIDQAASTIIKRFYYHKIQLDFIKSSIFLSISCNQYFAFIQYIIPFA